MNLLNQLHGFTKYRGTKDRRERRKENMVYFCSIKRLLEHGGTYYFGEVKILTATKCLHSKGRCYFSTVCSCFF